MTVTIGELNLSLGISACMKTVSDIEKKLDPGEINAIEAAFEEFIIEREKAVVEDLRKEVQHAVDKVIEWKFR